MLHLLPTLPPHRRTSRPLLPHLADPESVGRAVRDASRGVPRAAEWLSAQIVAHEAWRQIWQSVGGAERAEELALLIRAMQKALGTEDET